MLFKKIIIGSVRRLAVIGLALFLAGCGVFEVGIESTVAPQPTAAPTFTSAPTAAASPTPFPGLLRSGLPVRIVQINMLSRTQGWALGQVETDLTDHILFTQDGGQTWLDRSPGEALANTPAGGLSAVAYFDLQGGAWVVFSEHRPDQSPPASPVVWHTSDQGLNWQSGGVLDLTGSQAEFVSVSELGFLDDQHGWALAHLGAGMSHDYIAIFTTADGGKTWQRAADPQKTPDLMPCSKTGLAFSTAAIGYLTGYCPGLMDDLFFYTTSDGGQTWQKAGLLPPPGLPAEFLMKADSACGITGLVYSSARELMLTVRCQPAGTGKPTAWLYVGRDNLAPEAHSLPAPFGELTFNNPQEGWMVGADQNDPAASGAVYHTRDGGQTWSEVITTAWQGTPNFVDSGTGWVIARAADKLALVLTQDGGQTWQALSPIIGK